MADTATLGSTTSDSDSVARLVDSLDINVSANRDDVSNISLRGSINDLALDEVEEDKEKGRAENGEMVVVAEQHEQTAAVSSPDNGDSGGNAFEDRKVEVENPDELKRQSEKGGDMKQVEEGSQVVFEDTHSVQQQRKIEAAGCVEIGAETSTRREPTVLPEDQIHHVKYVTWGSTRYPVVTQNENGPCPLLAIVNVLLLRGQIHLTDNAQVVTGQQLVEHIGDCILRLAPQNLNERMRADYEHNVSDAMHVLNKLMTGLDVNVKFTGVHDFEYTNECIVFDLLGMPLYHGWLINSNDSQTLNAVGNKSYNQLVEAIISNRSSHDAHKMAEAAACEAFLESSASQLTNEGLAQLTAQMKDNEMAVFFRNNHFSTLMKHEGQLLLLVTDAGFLKEPNVVWETLSNVQNDSTFLDSSFKRVLPKEETVPDKATPPKDKQGQIDHDYLVALSLEHAEEEAGDASSGATAQSTPSGQVAQQTGTPEHNLDAQLAWQLQQEEDRLAAEGTGEAATGSAGPAQQHRHHREKKEKCTIL